MSSIPAGVVLLSDELSTQRNAHQPKLAADPST